MNAQLSWARDSCIGAVTAHWKGAHMPADVKGISAAKKVQREATQGGMRAALALEEIADHLEAMRSDALGYHNEVIAALKTLASR